MKADRMDAIEALIARAKKELNPDGLDWTDPGYEKTGHPLWGPVTGALGEALGEVYRLKARLHSIAQAAMKED